MASAPVLQQCKEQCKGISRHAGSVIIFSGKHVIHSRQILSPSKTGFMVSVHRWINMTLLTLVQANSKGNRRPISFMRKHTVIRTIGVSHSLHKMSSDEIFDLTAGVHFIFFVIYPGGK